MDFAGQPSNFFLLENKIRTLSRLLLRLMEIGQRLARNIFLQTSWLLKFLRPRELKPTNASKTSIQTQRSCAPIPLEVLLAATVSKYLFSKATTSTDDTGTGFVHTAPGHGREDFDIWMANARELEQRGINTTIPYTVDENGALTDQAPGFTGKRVINDKGEKGRCQRGRDQGADRRRHAIGTRPAQASISAFVALEEAGDLPQHAAMVHRDGQGYCGPSPDPFGVDLSPTGRGESRRYPACPRAARHLRHPMGAGIGREPHQRHDQQQARLGDLAAARLGRADRGCSVREKGDGSAEILQDAAVNKRIADAFELEGADAWYMDGAPRTLSRLACQRAMEKGRRHLRRLVRFRLDACVRAGGPRAFSGARRHQAQGRRRRRYRDVSGGFGPAPRLVPVVAAGKLRHPWPRAVRRGADSWFHARPERPQDVEVDRQHRRAAEDHRAIGRRYPAAVGFAPPITPTTSASARKSSRIPSRPTASCATRSAGCWARCITSGGTRRSLTPRCRNWSG